MKFGVNIWMVCLFLWMGAGFQGYFYETGYLMMTVISIGVALIAGYVLKSVSFHPYYHGPILLLVALYWGSIAYAVDHEKALLEAIKVTSLVPIALLAATITPEQRTSLYKAWVWSGSIVSIIGIAFHMDRNGRLESTFEYANAMAIYLLAAILLAILLYLKQRHKFYFVLMALNAAGLLLTMSRSVWVLWAGALLLTLVVFREARCRTAVVLAGAAHAAGYLLAALVRTDALFLWQRVKSIQPETSEFRIRLVYWQDSLSVIRDYWLGGTGGGGWSIIQAAYRSQMYYVRYVHNHYIQLALDIGVIGLVVFLVALVAFYIAGFRHIRRFDVLAGNAFWTKAAMLLAGCMLVHAGFDIDLEFPLLFGLLVVVLSVPFHRSKEPRARSAGNKPPLRTIFVSSTAICCMAFVMWVGVGYMVKEQAIQLVNQKKWEQAQAGFEKGASLMPWSHTILYESAKAYVRQSNETGDQAWLVLANAQLNEAIRRVPKEDLYQSLRVDLDKALSH